MLLSTSIFFSPLLTASSSASITRLPFFPAPLYFLAVPAISTICLSYTRLLREICEKLPIDMLQSVLSTDTEGLFLAYMDVSVPRQESVVEVIRCWGTRSSTSNGAEQEAACSAIKKLVEEFSLKVKDVNYAIEECHALINHLHPAGSVTGSVPSDAMSAHSG